MVDDKWIIVIEKETKKSVNINNKPIGKDFNYRIYAQKGITKKELEKKKGFVFTGREIQQVFNQIPKKKVTKRNALGHIRVLKKNNSNLLDIDYNPLTIAVVYPPFSKLLGKGIASRIELRVYQDLFKIFGNIPFHKNVLSEVREKQLKERYEIAGRDEKTYLRKGRVNGNLERNLGDEIKYLETFLREKQKEKMHSHVRKVISKVKRIVKRRAK